MSAYLVHIDAGADPNALRAALVSLGLWLQPFGDADAPRAFAVLAGSAEVSPGVLADVPGVARVDHAAPKRPQLDAMPRAVDVAGVPIGAGAAPVLLAGPCSIESEAQIHRLAEEVARQGARLLRGSAFKARTSPYSFQGAGPQALVWLREAADAHGLRVVSEVTGDAQLERVAEQADLLQIGTRLMYDYELLKRVGSLGKPVLLKRGLSATIDEWLHAAEYCLLYGAPGVVFCERGIRGTDAHTRNVLDVGAIALLAEVHGLPVIADPSHAAGRRDLIVPLGRAALAAGAHGVLVETHDRPGEAKSDGPQALAPDALAAFGLASDSAARGLGVVA